MNPQMNDKRELQFFKISTLFFLGMFLVLFVVAYFKRELIKRIYLRHRRNDEIKKCRTYLEENEDSDEKAAVLYKIARIYHSSLGDYSQAILEYKKFITEYPENILAENTYYYMGRCWEELGNFQRAKYEYETLFEKYPGGMRINDARLRMEEIEAMMNGENIE